MATATKTIYTVRPWVRVDLDHETDGATLEALATAIDNTAAIGPACAYDAATHELSALFQVEVSSEMSPAAVSIAALELFYTAARNAGVVADESGIALVEGDDPDKLSSP